jgi:hypothetical protein
MSVWLLLEHIESHFILGHEFVLMQNPLLFVAGDWDAAVVGGAEGDERVFDGISEAEMSPRLLVDDLTNILGLTRSLENQDPNHEVACERRWCCCDVAMHPPTHATLPNGICCVFLCATFVISVVMTTERLFFHVDVDSLETVSGTLWIATTTLISDASKSTTSSIEDVLFPSCRSESLLAAVVALVRIGSVAMVVFAVVGGVLVLLDGVWRSFPRFVVLAPVVALGFATILRWVCESALFSTRFCGQATLTERGFTETSSLTTKIVVVILSAMTGGLYFTLYPIHHLSRVLGIAPAEAQVADLRDPLLVGVGIAGLFSVAM